LGGAVADTAEPGAGMSVGLSTGADEDSPPAGRGPERDSLPVTVIEPRSGWALLHPAELWRYRELLWFLIWRDVKVRYKQRAVGAGLPDRLRAAGGRGRGRRGGPGLGLADPAAGGRRAAPGGRRAGAVARGGDGPLPRLPGDAAAAVAVVAVPDAGDLPAGRG